MLQLNQTINEHVYYKKNLADFPKDMEQGLTLDQEANIFATCLLMPKEAVYEYWEREQDINLIAIIFGVNVHAATWRLCQLGLIDVKNYKKNMTKKSIKNIKDSFYKVMLFWILFIALFILTGALQQLLNNTNLFVQITVALMGTIILVYNNSGVDK